jgi:membrane protein
MLAELQRHRPAGFELMSACAGALWAALNGTWALIFGLNTAYEVEESRGWWKLGSTIVSLTVVLAAGAGLAVAVLFSAVQIGGQVFQQPSLAALRVLEWSIVLATLLLSFAVVYRFAPNLGDAKWKWSTPGSLCALLLWVISTVGLRFYFRHISNYHQTYGHLNTVVMLLLWLYFTNAAILIGGEMNSEIEKAAASSSSRTTGVDTPHHRRLLKGSAQ